ncbi:MAG: DUF4143 domain-containing protein [Rectinemataceae bacterium]
MGPFPPLPQVRGWRCGRDRQPRGSHGALGSLSYFRTSDGAEVDFIIEKEGEIIPIEVKWSENPSLKDARHLKAFVTGHSSRCTRGNIVSRCPYVLELNERITAIPWWAL